MIVAALVLVLIFSRTICGFIIDYLWWQELGQVSTWVLMSFYRYAPGLAGWLIVFIILWVAHARGMKHAGTRLGEYPWYARLATLACALISLIVSLAAVDGWTVARYFGGAGLAASNEWHDPVFGKSLTFYFFELPFYNMLVHFLAACALLGALVYYLTARGWQIRRDFPGFGSRNEIDLSELRLLGRLESGMFRGLTTVFLVTLAATFYLGRYDFLLSDHGNLMVGIDYVQQTFGLPLQILKLVAALVAAILVLARQPKLALACAIVLIADIALPPLVSGLYVRPNELTLEKPFIQRHIEATRSAYGLDRNAREVEYPVHAEARIDFERNRPLLENVRLWDWRPFHDIISQKQPLRPYAYAETDVDRYVLDGKLRQVLLAPRELDLNQLGDARNRWINRSLIFTHGYGLVLAEANRITPEGLPELLVKDAPVQVLTPSVKITRPEIYYGESANEPVFVRTAQPEFNYPSGSSEVNIRYDGRGGFPMSGAGIRTVAAVANGDWNIVLTNALTPESRMQIRRRVPERLAELAEFISWDTDPYMVISESGRLVWIVDGYLTSEAHPYSRPVSVEGVGRFNYIRNSVKATVDAYDGDVHMYVFDIEDPLIRAYQRLFPTLFSPVAAMPADLRAHARAPEILFRTQAEIYRTYHMRDPELYYNRADLWDLATYTAGQATQAQVVTPTYMVATLPGETKPEFLLSVPFTPRNKQNLIGMMVTRCDGPHLNEIVFLQLPKQEVIPGPLQVEALINQDQNISKDLTLWNQQGSQVLRSQLLVLPIDQTFLYVAPIYIQASQARMPQLRRVVLAMGNTLIYADTYDRALAELRALQEGKPTPAATSTPTTTVSSAPEQTSATGNPRGDPRIEEIRNHLRRYRELAAQGKWAEAGKELEAIASTVK